jgi:hypothetical protein
LLFTALSENHAELCKEENPNLIQEDAYVNDRPATTIGEAPVVGEFEELLTMTGESYERVAVSELDQRNCDMSKY